MSALILLINIELFQESFAIALWPLVRVIRAYSAGCAPISTIPLFALVLLVEQAKHASNKVRSVHSKQQLHLEIYSIIVYCVSECSISSLEG